MKSSEQQILKVSLLPAIAALVLLAGKFVEQSWLVLFLALYLLLHLGGLTLLCLHTSVSKKHRELNGNESAEKELDKNQRQEAIKIIAVKELGALIIAHNEFSNNELNDSASRTIAGKSPKILSARREAKEEADKHASNLIFLLSPSHPEKPIGQASILDLIDEMLVLLFDATLEPTTTPVLLRDTTTEFELNESGFRSVLIHILLTIDNEALPNLSIRVSSYRNTVQLCFDGIGKLPKIGTIDELLTDPVRH